MFSDPLPVSLNGVDSINLARVLDDGAKSIYNSDDRLLTVTISHQTAQGGRDNAMFRIDQTKVAADPLTAVNKSVSASAWFVLSIPPFGFSNTDLLHLLNAIAAKMTTDTVTRFVSGQH